VQAGNIVLKYIRTKDQLADIFTKALEKGDFERLRGEIGVLDKYKENPDVISSREKGLVRCKGMEDLSKIPKSISLESKAKAAVRRNTRAFINRKKDEAHMSNDWKAYSVYKDLEDEEIVKDWRSTPGWFDEEKWEIEQEEKKAKKEENRMKKVNFREVCNSDAVSKAKKEKDEENIWFNEAKWDQHVIDKNLTKAKKVKLKGATIYYPYGISCLYVLLFLFLLPLTLANNMPFSIANSIVWQPSKLFPTVGYKDVTVRTKVHNLCDMWDKHIQPWDSMEVRNHHYCEKLYRENFQMPLHNLCPFETTPPSNFELFKPLNFTVEMPPKERPNDKHLHSLTKQFGQAPETLTDTNVNNYGTRKKRSLWSIVSYVLMTVVTAGSIGWGYTQSYKGSDMNDIKFKLAAATERLNHIDHHEEFVKKFEREVNTHTRQLDFKVDALQRDVYKLKRQIAKYAFGLSFVTARLVNSKAVAQEALHQVRDNKIPVELLDLSGIDATFNGTSNPEDGRYVSV